jgi:hypothetical protein
MNANITFFLDAKMNNQIILAHNAINPSCFQMDTALSINVNHIMILDVSLVNVGFILLGINPAKKYKMDALKPTKEYALSAFLIFNFWEELVKSKDASKPLVTSAKIVIKSMNL